MQNIIERIRELQARPVPPQDRYDVAILLNDIEGQHLPMITCDMEEDEFWSLEEDWMKALPEKDTVQRAGCYWMKVNGKTVRQGIILSNIISLTGVLIERQIEGMA